MGLGDPLALGVQALRPRLSPSCAPSALANLSIRYVCNINQSLYSNEVVQLERETEFFSLSSATYDFEEGVKSFLEKRKPIFKGE